MGKQEKRHLNFFFNNMFPYTQLSFYGTDKAWFGGWKRELQLHRQKRGGAHCYYNRLRRRRYRRNVTVTIDYDNLIEVLKLDNLNGMGVNYAISYADENGESQIMHSSGISPNNAVKTR